MPDRMLELGTLFKGTLDPSFLASVAKIKELLNQLSSAMSSASKGVDAYKKSTSSMGSELTQYQLMMGRATQESSKFQAALSQIASGTQRTGIALQRSWNAVASVEKALASLGIQMNAQNAKGDVFAQKMNLAAVAQDVLSNKVGITKGRFVQLADGISTASQAAINASSRYNPLATSVKKVSDSTDKFRGAMQSTGAELSQYQLMMGRATQESPKFQAALAQVAGGTQKTGIALQQAWGAVASVEKALSGLGLKMDAQGAKGKSFAANMNLTAVAQDVLANKLTISKGRFVQLGEGLSAASRAAVSASDRYAPLISNTNRMNEAVAVAKTGWQKLTGTFKQAISTMAAWGPAAVIVYGGLNTLKKAINEIIGFDQALANLKAISNDTDAAVARMGDKIIQVADKTRYSATEIADAMTLIAQAGFSSGESIEVVEAAALLASGTLEKMTTTADLLTSTIRAFNLDATEASRVADTYAAALNYTKLNVDGLRTTMNYLGPAAYASGLSLEEAAAAAGILADSGMRFSTIGTNLRQMLARLIAPTEKLRSAFAENGIELSKVNPLTTDFADVIANLAKVIPNSQRAFELFGLRGANAVLVLTRVGAEGFKLMVENLMTVGNASTMAEKQMQGLGAMFENVSAKLKNLAIAFGQGGLATAMRSVIEIIRPMIDLFNVLITSALGQFVISVGLVSGALYGLTKAFIALGLASAAMEFASKIRGMMLLVDTAVRLEGVMGLLTITLRGLWATIAAHPIGAVVVALGTLAVALQMARQHQAAATLEAEKNALQYTRNVELLGKYRDKLDKATEGSLEHTHIMARLIKDFPELQYKIEAAGNSIEKQKQLIDELTEAQKKLAVKNLTVAIKGHTESFEELSYKIVQARDNLRSYAEDPAWLQLFNLMGDLFRGDVTNALNRTKLLWTELSGSMSGTTTALETLSNNYNEVSNQQKRTKQTLGELAADYERFTGKPWDFGDLSIPVNVAKSMYDLKKAVQEAEKAYEDLDETTRKALQREIVENMGQQWIDLYDKLDDAGKAHVAHFANQANAKQSKVDEQAAKEKLSAEQVSARKKEIADDEFKTMVQKEKQKVQELLGVYEKYLQDYMKYSQNHIKAIDNLYESQKETLRQVYADRLLQLDRTYQAELTKLEMSKMREGAMVREKNALHDKYYKDITVLHRQYMNEQLVMADQETADKKRALDDAYNNVLNNVKQQSDQFSKLKDLALQMEREKEEGIIAIDRENIANKKAILNEILNATRQHIDQLKGEYASLASEIKGIDEKLSAYKNELFAGERKIRQSAMNESQKYADNMKEYQRLIGEGNKALYSNSYKEAEKYFNEAAQLAQGMTGEIKNEGGAIVVTAQENAKKLEVMYRQAMEGYKKTMESQRAADSARMEELMKMINDVIALEEDVKKKIVEVNQTEMRINTQEADSALKGLQSDLAQIQQMINTLNGSTITIYKNIVVSESSGGSSSSSSSSESGSSDTGTWSTGGQLPGYGGGDSVQALLEPGEFVMRKEAVRKYGAGFFEALNNMRMVLPNAVKRYLGGTFGSRPSYAMGYQGGGVVGRSETLVVRLQAGASELPVVVTGKNPKQRVKEFVKELSKMRLTRVR